jgi:hypothetical protein
MKHFFMLFLTALLPLSANASWTVKSQFELILSETLFDQVIGDFGNVLQGTNTIPINDISTTAQGFPVAIKGISADVDYDFPVPTRISSNPREWKLATNKLSSRLTVDSVTASGEVLKIINGIRVRVRLNAECRNVKLHLPENQSHVAANIRAEVSNGQIKLSLPTYDADWTKNAWIVDSMSCTGVEGFENVVKEEALKALSSFHNFDEPVKKMLGEKFAEWSQNASVLLMSQQEIPTGKNYMKAFFEPSSAQDSSHGLLISGNLRFVYPRVAPGQALEYVHRLSGSQSLAGESNPQVMVPFAMVRSLMMGEYFAGKLSYRMTSTQVPSFRDFMNSPFQKFFGFPELNRFSNETEFAFDFAPAGPPAFNRERAAGKNVIQGDMNMPLAVRMSPEIGGVYTPMVEFRTLLAGPSTLTLGKDGKIAVQVNSQASPVTYAWNANYVRNYNPSQYIAADTIGEKVRSALGGQGFSMQFPTLVVGPTVTLAPQSWELMQGSDLRVSFGTVAPARLKNAKTALLRK